MSRLSDHNREMIASAEYRAEEMRTWPSKLESIMKDYLDSYHIEHEFQKIFYICADDGWIIKYYIADFYIPDKKIIIEVDGKFHNDQKQHDKMRTRTIQEYYPDVEVLRFNWKEVNDFNTMADLVDMLRGLESI